MRKTIFALIALFPLSAFAAAATWAPVSTTNKCWLPPAPTSSGVTPRWTNQNSNCRSVVGTCTGSGTCDAFAVTDGLSLADVATIRVKVCPDSGKKLTGGSIVLYTVDATAAAKWLTLTVPNVNVVDVCAELTGDSPGLGIPVLGARGQLIPVPAVTVDAGGIVMTVTATGYAGQSL